jgi:hypothetical protein
MAFSFFFPKKYTNFFKTSNHVLPSNSVNCYVFCLCVLWLLVKENCNVGPPTCNFFNQVHELYYIRFHFGILTFSIVPIGYFYNNPLFYPIYFSIIWFSISLIKIINIWIVLIIFLLVLINHKIPFNLSVEVR